MNSERTSHQGNIRNLFLIMMIASFGITWTVLNKPAAAQTSQPSGSHATGDIEGTWQGTLEAQKSLRTVLKITKTDKGLAAKMYSIDQGGQPINASSVMLEGAKFKYAVDMIGGSYEGTLSADRNSIAGTWTQGGKPLPLTLVRATKETAWEIPVPVPPKLMAADADPAFDVATIKPNNTGATSMQALFVNGRNFSTRASSLSDLIAFSYDVQMKQIVGGPDWITKDRYDIAAVPDVDGAPNTAQLRTMIRKLLTDRFQLTFHKEKRELAAYVLTASKGSEKLTVNESKGPLPGFGLRPSPAGISIPVRNATMKEFASFLQTLVLDRPVVDQTGLTGRFDFIMTFTPDDSQFNGHPPPLPAKTDATEAAPSLFEAMQQPGLKLDAQKTQVEVIAIDHVEKPSAN